LPLLKPYLSEEDYNHFKHTLDNNWEGLLALDKNIFVKMFGYKDRQDYYD